VLESSVPRLHGAEGLHVPLEENDRFWIIDDYESGTRAPIV